MDHGAESAKVMSFFDLGGQRKPEALSCHNLLTTMAGEVADDRGNEEGRLGEYCQPDAVEACPSVSDEPFETVRFDDTIVAVR